MATARMPSNSLLLGKDASGEPVSVVVLAQDPRRAPAEKNVLYEGPLGSPLLDSAPLRVDENTHLLVTRPRDSDAFRDKSNTPIRCCNGLGDVIQPGNRRHEPPVDAR